MFQGKESWKNTLLIEIIPLSLKGVCLHEQRSEEEKETFISGIGMRDNLGTILSKAEIYGNIIATSKTFFSYENEESKRVTIKPEAAFEDNSKEKEPLNKFILLLSGILNSGYSNVELIDFHFNYY